MDPLRDEDRQSAPPAPGAVLVVERWNTWVRVYCPETDEYSWVDLRETPFQKLVESFERAEN